MHDKPVTVIQASSGWGTLKLRELWDYRELIWVFAHRDIQVRYRQMALGPLWIVITPLISMVIFSLIFGRLAKLPSDGIPYPIFTYTALLPWTYFANATNNASSSLFNARNTISKIYFPRLATPLSSVFSGLLDLSISFLVLLAMMAYYGFGLSWAVLLLPGFVLFAMITALSVGLWNANLVVRFRDLRFGISYGLQVWMYATPVAYSASLIPDRWQAIYQLNPMYWVIEGFRWALLGQGNSPTLIMLIPMTGVFIALISGIFIFQRHERTISDIV